MTRAGKSALAGQPTEDQIKFVEDLKRQWMAMIDALVDPMMIVQNDYTIAKANKAMGRLANQDVKDIIGKSCYAVFAGRNAPCPGCNMQQTGASAESQQWSLNEVRTGRYYEVTSQPIIEPDGSMGGVVQVYRDRTEARQMQEQLLQSEKLASIGLLAGGVAHELNNPLSGIMVFAQMIHREMAPDDRHFQDVEEILNATQRCKAIVENLLDFARKRPANRADQPQAVDLIGAARTALRFAKVGMNRNDVDVEEDWHAEEVTVMGDRNKMIQVFLNLIQNAFHAMPDGGVLSLRSRLFDSKGGEARVIFEVSDTGVGIPAEQRSRIFDPFFTTKEPGEGTGLGLSICYSIVDEAGGSLTVDSKLNVGTTFRISFPIRLLRLAVTA